VLKSVTNILRLNVARELKSVCTFYQRSASDARVLAIILCLCVCLSVCHMPVLYQNS